MNNLPISRPLKKMSIPSNIDNLWNTGKGGYCELLLFLSFSKPCLFL